MEDYGTDYLFRVRIRLGFKVSQSIPAYLHQIMHDLLHGGDLPQQTTRYPKVDADPEIGPITYVLIHKALMPESKVSAKGAWALRIKYAIRHVAGSPVKQITERGALAHAKHLVEAHIDIRGGVSQ